MAQTKIVCTIGPACREEATLRSMMCAGMNVARINFSHGTHQEHESAIAALRKIASEMGHPLAIMQDLSGPKIRIGEVPGGALPLKIGDCLTLTSAPTEVGTPQVELRFPAIYEAAAPGSCLGLDDGTIQLVVEEQSPTRLLCRTVVGGVLKPHKGISLPGVTLPIACLTDRDREDIRFGVEHSVDWVALSFVRSAHDVVALREAIRDAGGSVPIIAKIEKHEAVEHLGAIIDAADGVMVARGDLGVELPLESVPLIQKQIISACNALGKPVITATQMLESMIQNPRPTRAEVADVCNAILDGTDAVMLSAETAAGSYPVESVEVMARIAERTDRSLKHREIMHARQLETGNGVPDAISEGASEIAERLQVDAIVCATSSGAMARLVSRFRPHCPIIAATTVPTVYNQLALTWGIRPVLVPRAHSLDGTLENAIQGALRTGLVKEGDRVLLTAGSIIENAGTTNLIKVQVVGQAG